MNPVLCLIEGNGSLAGRDRAGAFTATGSGALRYAPANGARVNLLGNTRAASSTTGWFAQNNATVTRKTDDPTMPTCFDVVGSGGATYQQLFAGSAAGYARVSIGQTVTVSYDAKLVSGYAVCSVSANAYSASGSYLGSGAASITPSTATYTTTWLRYSHTITVASTVGLEQIGLTMSNATTNAMEWLITNIVIEVGTPSSATYFAGDSTGAVWLDPVTGILGTANASPSVSRATFWIEEGTTNLVTNPWRSVDNSGYSAVNGSTARSTSYAYQGPGAGLLTASAANAEEIISITAAASSHTAQAIVRNLNASSRTCQLYYNGSAIGSSSSVASGETKTITAAFTGTGGAANLSIRWTDSANTETFAHYYLGAEAKAYATSPCPVINASGTIQSGYSWSGTAHASTSSRTAATVNTTAANRVNLSSGSFIFRARTGGAATTGSRFVTIGNWSDGTNDKYLTFAATDTDLRFSSQTAGVANPSATISNAFAAQAWNDCYAAYTPTTASVAEDGSALTTITKSQTPTYTLTSDRIAIGDSTGQSFIGPVVIYNRPLTAAERAKVNAAIDSNGAASLWTVLGSNSYRNFQLRPISQ